MRVVSWNCNGALRKKSHLLDSMDADIFVIQECEDPEKIGGAYRDWAFNYLWCGNNKNRGLGIFARREIDLTALNWPCGEFQLFLPCRVNDSFNLLAVWTKSARNLGYIGQFWSYLQINKEIIASAPVCICGDFNSNIIWDKKSRHWNHSDVVRELEEISISSLYHRHTKELQGTEKNPTLFMYRNAQKAYHIDYAFVSSSLMGLENSIDIGRPEIWLKYSDHMPITFNVMHS